MFDREERVLFLSPRERLRLAAWLTPQRPVREINPGRWQQLCDGSTDYISFRELGHLMDFAIPVGWALDVIRGTTVITVQESEAAYSIDA